MRYIILYVPASNTGNLYRTTAVSTKLTAPEAARLKSRADAAGVPVGTFVRTALLRSRLKGTCVPRLNQDGWTRLVNLESAVLKALPGSVDEVSLAAFTSELAALRAALIGGVR